MHAVLKPSDKKGFSTGARRKYAASVRHSVRLKRPAFCHAAATVLKSGLQKVGCRACPGSKTTPLFTLYTTLGLHRPV